MKEQTASEQDENSIRKKQKRISRDSWRSKIQAYSFGIDPPTFYTGYCPFFWMIGPAIIISPFVFICRFLLKIWNRFDAMLNWSSSHFADIREMKKEALANTSLRPSNLIILGIGGWKDFGDYTDEDVQASRISYVFCIDHMRARQYAKWFEENLFWYEDYYPAVKAAVLKEKEDMRKRNEILERRKERFRKISNKFSLCMSIIFKIVFPILLTFVAFCFVGLLISLASTVTLTGALSAFIVICAAAALIITCAISIDGIRTFLSYRK